MEYNRWIQFINLLAYIDKLKNLLEDLHISLLTKSIELLFRFSQNRINDKCSERWFQFCKKNFMNNSFVEMELKELEKNNGW